jgi:murein peptide amidase A
MKSFNFFKFGQSVLNLPIHGYRWNENQQGLVKVLILGGVHGDEPEGVVAAKGLIEEFRKNFNLNLDLTVIPEFNIEGVLLHTRGNSNKVDLNRNLPTTDWSPIAATERYFPGPSALSETENQHLVDWIKKEKPDVIYSLHSWKPMLNTNGILPEATEIAKYTGYIIEPDIGYPTPGSLGTYAGLENKIPTLTYEIERDISFDQIIKIHVPALIAGLKISESRQKKASL